MRTLCIDFDGVMNCYRGWKEGEAIPGPQPGLAEFLVALRRRRWRVVIHSCRPASEIRDWLKLYALEDYIADVSCQKVPAVLYLDDRGLTFRGDFQRALEEIDGFRAYWEEAAEEGSVVMLKEPLVDTPIVEIRREFKRRLG